MEAARGVWGLLLLLAVGTGARILFTKEPSSQDALHGRSAMLRCEVAEPSDVAVQWLHNGLPVQDSERRFQEGSSLQFTAVDRQQDAGAFQCVATSRLTGEEARTANASFNIKCESERRARGLGLPAAFPCRGTPALLESPLPRACAAAWPLRPAPQGPPLGTAGPRESSPQS
ncbi:inactive tyrosine-protein kinase 7-like [Pelodiscus sinensis]|uniref:inactive tyrosine-protein kinase 7-like n=1 Tax=Pelodiscus sinensis TaxID=13735 RepID=UPI003F6C9B20